MKAYPTQHIRNVVLLGSTKSGKTTLSEAMLYEGKVIDRRGTVEAKNTVSDNAEIEQINQRSIYATPLYAEFMDTNSISLTLRVPMTLWAAQFPLSRFATWECS